MATSSSSSLFSIPSPARRLRLAASRSAHHDLLLLPLLPSRALTGLRASRRFSNYPQEAVVVVPDPRAWAGDLGNDGRGEEDDEDEEDDEEEEDRSLDLLVRFLENVFRRTSRRARRAVRSVLPSSVSTKLVRFAVNGVLMLAFLWILKALLEVVCTFGSIVFVTILLVRGIWSGVSYINWSRYHYVNRIDNDESAWSGVQPAA